MLQWWLILTEYIHTWSLGLKDCWDSTRSACIGCIFLWALNLDSPPVWSPQCSSELVEIGLWWADFSPVLEIVLYVHTVHTITVHNSDSPHACVSLLFLMGVQPSSLLLNSVSSLWGMLGLVLSWLSASSENTSLLFLFQVSLPSISSIFLFWFSSLLWSEDPGVCLRKRVGRIISHGHYREDKKTEGLLFTVLVWWCSP